MPQYLLKYDFKDLDNLIANSAPCITKPTKNPKEVYSKLCNSMAEEIQKNLEM